MKDSMVSKLQNLDQSHNLVHIYMRRTYQSRFQSIMVLGPDASVFKSLFGDDHFILSSIDEYDP
jgi:hypothetical protein